MNIYGYVCRKNQSMKVLGFLVQFEEVNGKGLEGLYGTLFFNKTIEKISIKTNIVKNRLVC